MLAILLVLAIVCGLCACGNSAATSSAPQAETPATPQDKAPTGTEEIEEITFSLGDPATTGTFLTNNAEFFAEKVKELSGGRMQVEVFADALLGTEDALLSNIQTGALEMGNFSSTFANLVRRAGIFDFPYFISDRSQLELLEQGGVIDEIAREAENYNIKLIAINENGFRQITNNIRPIYTPDDLKGIVIRTPSNTLRVRTFEALGATPIAISFSELYQSLSQGICDAQENPVSQVISAQLYDHQPYLSISNHIYTPAWICMNLDLYNSLSDAQKAVIDEAGRLTTKHVREIAQEEDEKTLQKCIDAGMEVNYVDTEAFRQVVMPLWDEFAESVGGVEFVNLAKKALGY